MVCNGWVQTLLDNTGSYVHLALWLKSFCAGNALVLYKEYLLNTWL